MISPFANTDDILANFQEIRRTAAGESNTVSVLERHPELLDMYTSGPIAQTQEPGADMANNTRQRLAFVFHRDAKHLVATRGRLLQHGLQDKFARLLDVGDVLTLNTEST